MLTAHRLLSRGPALGLFLLAVGATTLAQVERFPRTRDLGRAAVQYRANDKVRAELPIVLE